MFDQATCFEPPFASTVVLSHINVIIEDDYRVAFFVAWHYYHYVSREDRATLGSDPSARETTGQEAEDSRFPSFPFIPLPGLKSDKPIRFSFITPNTFDVCTTDIIIIFSNFISHIFLRLKSLLKFTEILREHTHCEIGPLGQHLVDTFPLPGIHR